MLRGCRTGLLLSGRASVRIQWRAGGALVLGRRIGWRARNMGELPADAQGDRECADRQLRRVRDPVSQADEERYILAPDDVEFVDRLIETLVNLVGRIYGKV